MVLRLTCLASAVVALAGAANAQTPTVQPTPSEAPLTPGLDDILLQADTITDDYVNKTTVAEGNVEVRARGRILRADRLIFDQNKQSIRAQGHVQIVDESGAAQFADEIESDDEFLNGFATKFSARLGANAQLTASAAVRTDGVRNALEQVVYSGCPACEGDNPTWQLRSRVAEQNTETQMISYQDAVLEIKGIPVLYVPWFAHADPTSKRRTGLLAPEDIGVSSKIGPFFEQPYYIALSPYSDMTISTLLSQEVTPLIKVDYRKRFFSGFVDFQSSFTYENEFDSDGNKFGDDTWRSHLYGMGRFAINQDWQWGFGVERQTDDLYDQRYDIDGEDDLRGLFASQPRQLLSQIYTTGQSEDFYLEAGAYVFQGLRLGDDDARFPKVAPALFAEKVFDLGEAGQISTDFSAVGLFRDAVETRPTGEMLLDTARATARADWGSQYIVGPGLVVEPFAQGRGDAYHFDTGGATGKQDITRFLGVAGAQVSYPFMRRGANTTIIVEPIAMVAYGTPDANNDGIPNEDSLVFEADESNLFKPNPNSNYDLWEGGARASVGLSATAQIGKDVELSALFGRRWREDADPAFNNLSNLSGEKSDYVASVKLDLGPSFSLGSRMRMDDSFEINRIDLNAHADFWRLKGDARYFKVAENASGVKDEGIIWNGSFKLTDHFSAIAQQQRNIALDENIRVSLGLAYRDDCSFFAISYERSGGRDRTLGPSESIRFQFVLTGLGGVSDSDTD